MRFLLEKMWEFSQEVQSELQQFLLIVEQKSIPNQRIKSIWEKINPTLVAPQSVEIHNKTLINNDCTQILDATHDMSVLNITSTSNDLINPDVYDFLELIEENLEDTILTKPDVLKLCQYNPATLTFMFSKLDISDQGLFNLNHSFCTYSDINITLIVELFCRNLLLPKINSNISQILQSLLKEISKSFPQITRSELLIPLLMNNSTKLNFVINVLSDTEIQYFLRDFIFSCNELELNQLDVLQNLLRDKTEDSVKRRLITLMEASSDKFSQEKLFLKLTIKLIQNLGEGFDDQEQSLHNVIEKNQTLLKVSAQKALREWITKYNN